MDLDFLGPFFSDDVAWGVVTGQLDPHTHRPYASLTMQVTDRSADKHSAEGAEMRNGSGELGNGGNTNGLSTLSVCCDRHDFDDDRYYISDINSVFDQRLDDCRGVEERSPFPSSAEQRNDYGYDPLTTDEADRKRSTAVRLINGEKRGAVNGQQMLKVLGSKAQKGQAKAGRVVWVEEADRQKERQGEGVGDKGGASSNCSSSMIEIGTKMKMRAGCKEHSHLRRQSQSTSRIYPSIHQSIHPSIHQLIV